MNVQADSSATGPPLSHRSWRVLLQAAVAFPAGLVGLVLELPVLLLTLPFWAVDSLTGWIAERIGRRPRPWQALIDFDPAFGWTPRRGVRTWAADLRQDTFRLTTDAEGWRGRETLESADLVVFGDSFAHGFGVEDRSFFADVARGVRIKAIGCPGYNLVQSLLWMERLADRIEGKLVVWLVYLGNDLEDNLYPASGRYRQPFVRFGPEDGRWTIVRSHLRPDRWSVSSQEGGPSGYVELCCGGFPLNRALAAFEYLARRAARTCARAGSRLVVATVPEASRVARREIEAAVSRLAHPEAFDEERLERGVEEVCRDLGISSLRLGDYLGRAEYLRHDYHWNARGHRRVASVLEALNERERSREQGTRTAVRLRMTLGTPRAAGALSHTASRRPRH